MSTKTTFKRIALVAVAALGFGTLSSVAPASAVAGTITGVTVGASTPARVGIATATTITTSWAAAADITTGDTFTVTARVTSSPTGSVMRGLSVADNVTAVGSVLGFVAKTGDNGSTVTNTGTAFVAGGVSSVQVSGAVIAANVTATAKSVGTTLAFIPDIAGSYQILVTAGTKSAYWTITTVGAPASVVLSSVNSTVAQTATTGARIKVVLLDAAGSVTRPDTNETLAVSDSSSSSAPTVTSLGSNDFSLGYALFYVKDSDATNGAAGYTSVVSVAGDGTTISASVNSNITVTFRVNTAGKTDLLLGDGTDPDTSTGTATPDGWEFQTDDNYKASTAGSYGTVMIASTASATAAQYYSVTVTDNGGDISGVAGTVLDMVATQAAASTVAYATLTIATAPSDGDNIVFALYGGAETVTVTGEDPAIEDWTVDVASQRAAVGGAITIKATAYDQFGIEIANSPVAVSVSGRNTVAAKNYVSDADGRISFSYTDLGTATTLAVVDTVAIGSFDTATVTFGTYAVGTVTVTGGATANTVAFPAVGSTTKAISTGATGAAAATTTFTATVKDANGNLLAGVPVTWTVDSATAGITKSATSDASTCITGSAGTCTTTVYAWAAPSKVTVTATAGTKTGTGYENFVNAATDARVLSATVSGSLAVAKVVDRYGNPVSGVTVSAKTSNGYFGSGATSTTGVTTTDGTVGFALTGVGTVTLSVDSSTYTQTDDAAGKVGTTAVTAAVAGTSTGVGASLSPAGVNSVAVEVTEGTNSAAQAAADAAAEATDAANAATDAANAAAEAADAATAAAQDAADAVAALSTQVSEMVSALKKQITALTNLVIKIQKKVNA
jgi:trimeric autotransporter adhesin